MFGINNKIKIQSDDIFGEKYVTVVSDKLQKTIETIYNYDIKTIVIKTYDGYSFKDLEWLKECSFIDQVHLFCYEDNFELKGLHYLKDMKLLNLNVTAKKMSQELDFGYFSKLQNCSLDWNPKMENLFNCITLQRLSLRKFKGKNLKGIDNLSNLNELLINNSLIEGLIGLEGLAINSLKLSYLKKLETLNGINTLVESLKILELENCPKIEKIDYMEVLSNLQKLGLNNCKQIDSLKPIQNLNKLQQFDFWGNTSILDGDMSPCIGIRKVAFENRKHYNYKNEEIDRINENR